MSEAPAMEKGTEQRTLNTAEPATLCVCIDTADLYIVLCSSDILLSSFSFSMSYNI